MTFVMVSMLPTDVGVLAVHWQLKKLNVTFKFNYIFKEITYTKVLNAVSVIQMLLGQFGGAIFFWPIVLEMFWYQTTLSIKVLANKVQSLFSEIDLLQQRKKKLAYYFNINYLCKTFLITE